MNNIAFLFPGQGAQYVGMGKDLYEKSLPAKNIFDKADNVLGFSISSLCFEGPQEALAHTKNCQLAILVTSIAAFEAFKASVPVLPTDRPAGNIKYCAGLSLGEYSALVAAGAISFEEALVLVRKRSELMAHAAEKFPGKMLAVLGLDLDIVKGLAREAGIEIANLNCPGQVVVTGKSRDIDAFNALAQAKGVKRLIELEVSGAFHSSLMSEASIEFKAILDKAGFKMPEISVISNVTAKPFTSVQEIRQNLALQIKSSVLWEDSVRFMMAQGINKFFEIGPGRTLKGILRKIDPGLEVVNIEKTEDITK